MRVEATVRETDELHQIGHAYAVDAGLAQNTRGFLDDPVPGLQAMAFHVAHGRLSSMLISPFFSEWANLAEKGPGRTVLLVEVPQFIGDCGRLDKELIRRVRQTFAHARHIDHGIDEDVRDVDTARSEIARDRFR